MSTQYSSFKSANSVQALLPHCQFQLWQHQVTKQVTGELRIPAGTPAHLVFHVVSQLKAKGRLVSSSVPAKETYSRLQRWASIKFTGTVEGFILLRRTCQKTSNLLKLDQQQQQIWESLGVKSAPKTDRIWQRPQFETRTLTFATFAECQQSMQSYKSQGLTAFGFKKVDDSYQFSVKVPATPQSEPVTEPAPVVEATPVEAIAPEAAVEVTDAPVQEDDLCNLSVQQLAELCKANGWLPKKGSGSKGGLSALKGLGVSVLKQLIREGRAAK